MTESPEEGDVSPSVGIEVLTPVEVAKILKVSKDWVYDECKAGRMPSIRLGRNVRILPDALKAYLQDLSTQ